MVEQYFEWVIWLFPKSEYEKVLWTSLVLVLVSLTGSLVLCYADRNEPARDVGLDLLEWYN